MLRASITRCSLSRAGVWNASLRVALCRSDVLRRGLADNSLTTPLPSDESGKVSKYTPVTHMDPATVAAFTGAPQAQLEKRVVKIFKPAQGVQSATQNTLSWKMQWEDNSTERWTNPTMGWTSTRDPLSNTHMTLEFQTLDEAELFAQRNGWKYEVQAVPSPNLAIVSKGPKKYADNFKWKGPKGRPFPQLYEPPPPPPKK